MNVIKTGAYLSPKTEVFGLRCEGVLCESVEADYEGSTSQGYSSKDDLFEIF